MANLSKYSFGATSAVTTSLAIIAGLGSTINPKISIVSTLLVLAIADNISDSLGIHVFQESQCKSPKDMKKVYTLTNFFARLSITLCFIFIILIFPIQNAIITAAILGLLIIAAMSYLIAKNQNTSPYKAILEHVGVAVVLMVISRFLVELITATVV